MTTNLSGNTLTLGSYALTASQSGTIVIGKISIYNTKYVSGRPETLNFPIASIYYFNATAAAAVFTGKWSGIRFSYPATSSEMNITRIEEDTAYLLMQVS